MNRMTLVLTLAALSTSVAAAQTGGTPGGPAATAGTRGSAAGGPAATAGTRGGAAYDTSGGQRPGAQPGRGDTGRLGTNHPNAAAGPIRRSGATQTGPGRTNARNRATAGAQPRAGAVQRVVPGIPLIPAVPLEGPTVPIPGEPAVPPTAGGAAPVDGTVVPPGGGAAVPAQTRMLPPIGSGDDDEPLPQDRETRHVIAPLAGDLEFGMQPRGGSPDALSVLSRQAQLSHMTAEARRRQYIARRPAGPAGAERERNAVPPRMHYAGGRWWYHSQTGGWLIWDAVTRSWAPFRPGALGHL